MALRKEGRRAETLKPKKKVGGKISRREEIGLKRKGERKSTHAHTRREET